MLNNDPRDTREHARTRDLRPDGKPIGRYQRGISEFSQTKPLVPEHLEEAAAENNKKTGWGES